MTDVVWDDAGNRVGFGSDAYTFDARNRLLTGPEGTHVYTARGTLLTLSEGLAFQRPDVESPVREELTMGVAARG